jgi:hypothetical protein
LERRSCWKIKIKIHTKQNRTQNERRLWILDILGCSC